MFDRADLTRQDGAERIQGGLFMDPYRNLISNTVLFGLSTFGARLLTFLLTPFYTRVLSSAEYGLTDLLLQTGNLIIPIASVGIANAVIRYGLEQSRDKRGVFTIGMLTTLTGFCLLLLAAPLLGQIGFLSGYLHLVLLYVLANVLADGITTAFVFLCARQWRYLRLSAVKRREAARMLRYSAPLVPANLCGWIINISDRYLIALLIGSAATGIYAVSNKLPNVLLTAATTFSSAWQLSALSERPRREKERFFSNVYSVYSAMAWVVASGVILTAKLSTRLLAAPEYYEAWRYVPVLTLATTFACLGSFLASIYMVEQRSASTLATTVLGAVCNLAGNFFLIRLWGSMGAAVSTLLSYILIFAVRAVHTRSLLRIRWGLARLLPSAFILCVQCVLMEREVPAWQACSGLCFLAVALINHRPLWDALQKAA